MLSWAKMFTKVLSQICEIIYTFNSVFFFLLQTGLTASVYMTISLTLERYFSIVQPLYQLKNRWAFSLLVIGYNFHNHVTDGSAPAPPCLCPASSSLFSSLCQTISNSEQSSSKTNLLPLKKMTHSTRWKNVLSS